MYRFPNCESLLVSIIAIRSNIFILRKCDILESVINIPETFFITVFIHEYSGILYNELLIIEEKVWFISSSSFLTLEINLLILKLGNPLAVHLANSFLSNDVTKSPVWNSI